MKVEFRTFKGVWFSWPVIIYYPYMGIEIRFLVWSISIDKDREYMPRIIFPESEVKDDK